MELHSPSKEGAILSLGRKTFFLRPICLDRYLNNLPLSATTREVFWLHWGMGYREHSITTTLSINQVAGYLKISPSTVSRAYDQLISHDLLIRRSLAAAHGGWGITETTINIPDTVLTSMLSDNRDRSGCPPSDIPHNGGMISIGQDATNEAVFSTPDVQETVSSSASDTLVPATTPIVASLAEEQTSRIDLEQRIEELDRQIAHWNATAIQCSETKDLTGYHQAVTNAEQAQHRRESLRTELAKRSEGQSQSSGSNNNTPAAITETESSEHASAHQTAPAATNSAAINPAVTTPAATTPVTTNPAATNPATTSRQLGTTARNEIFQRVAAINQVSHPKGVAQEIIYSIEQGAQANRPVPWAINAAIKMVENNVWRTPYGFASKTEEGVPSNCREGYPPIAGAL